MGNGNLTIVTRDEWGARPPRTSLEEQNYDTLYNEGRRKKLSLDKVLDKVLDSVVIHHSGWTPTYEPQQLQDFFMDERGYDDIGYHFYIMADGRIVEARELKYVGGHAGRSQEADALHDIKKDPDYGSIGIALAGCFDVSCKDTHVITDDQVVALESLLVYLIDDFPHITAERIFLHGEVNDHLIRAKGLTPHRAAPSDCPGRDATPAILELREELIEKGE